MKIKKMYQGTVPQNKILNAYTESSTDTYCCDYLNPTAITIGLSTEFRHTTGSSVKIPLDTVLYNMGDGLSFDSTDNCVVIGEGISYVEVSGHVMQSTSSANLCGLLIEKNQLYLNNAVSVGFSYINATSQIVCNSLSPVVIPVEEGDKLYLVGYSDSSSKTVTYTPYAGRSNYLTVKKVR